ncbi:MAG: hypothetical protein JWP37_1725 [Mucilaginibacter sp.]|nr:hypothetical protein [Mucilaginibacter sp.]
MYNYLFKILIILVNINSENYSTAKHQSNIFINTAFFQFFTNGI